ncbi:CPBP family intramembrane metalloprotease [Oscillatoria amoena NRMC-F 0135]|nr:CPBP family intramembrane metalloprotease [Oscillatoria amoena NRMC-F 0135]
MDFPANATAVACTLGLLWLMWSLQGKLTTHGFEFLNWHPVSRASIGIAFIAGMTAGLIAAYVFHDYGRSASPAFTEVWLAITIGPLFEELVFRGYLFWAVGTLLQRLAPPLRPVTTIWVAALFSLAHAPKPGITDTQLAAIFGTGLLYGLLRQRSGSTVPPVIAHMVFNALIYMAAVFF